jgi:hypothetical protein
MEFGSWVGDAAAISTKACLSGSLVPDVKEGTGGAVVLTARPSVSEGDGGLSVTRFKRSVESVDGVKDGICGQAATMSLLFVKESEEDAGPFAM